jgi:shikimate kinase
MIFLIGYRGTGKTTVARVLAQRLGWKWSDADSELEVQEGRRISDIFARDGESVFRDMEARVLAELCKLSRHVIATGGGVILRETNRERMRQSGRVVWLKSDLETIWMRLKADALAGRKRPALTTGGREEVEQLLRTREPLYRACADLVVETGDRAPEAIAEEIATWVSA